MERLKELFRDKRVIMIIILLISIVAILSIRIVLKKDNNNDDEVVKVLKEEKYTMYVKINPLVKIEFGEKYYICSENKVDKVCSDKTNKVTEFVLINDDAKELYGDLDLEGLSVIDALVKIYDAAREEEIDFDTIEIIANYEFDSENLTNEIEEKSEYKVEFNVITNYDKELIEDDVISSVEKDVYYTVKFDSNGGSKVGSVKVKEGYGFTKPSNPTRKGYKFVEWQLNGKKYDFKSKVSKNVTLKAKWEKVEEEKKEKENTNTNKPVENEKNEETNVNSNKINLNDKVMVTEYTVEYMNKDCWFLMFATNLKEVFPNAVISGSGPYSVTYWAGPNAVETEISEAGLTENFNLLKFDTANETKLLNILAKYKNGYKGVAEVEYANNNHRINFKYRYIEFVDSSYEQVGKNADAAVDDILKNATRFNGPCGFAEENKKVELTEELCSKYSLDCGRW